MWISGERECSTGQPTTQAAREVDEVFSQVSPELRKEFLEFLKAQGTIRGLHFQRPPQAQAKLVRDR